jgi:hypothetical protein
MARKKPSKRELDELYEDIPRHRRAKFMSDALALAEKGVRDVETDHGGKPASKIYASKAALEALATLESIATERAKKEEIGWRLVLWKRSLEAERSEEALEHLKNTLAPNEYTKVLAIIAGSAGSSKAEGDEEG